MPIQISCPGCGGPIYVEGRADTAVCQFCGTRFKVDLEGVAPNLAKDSSPYSDPQPLPEPPNLPEPADLPEPPNLPEPQPVAEEWHPPQPEPPGTPYTPPPAYPAKPVPASPANQLLGGKLWLVIALVVGVITIGSCLCLVLAFQAVAGF